MNRKVIRYELIRITLDGKPQFDENGEPAYYRDRVAVYMDCGHSTVIPKKMVKKYSIGSDIYCHNCPDEEGQIMANKWTGTLPQKCDVCGKELKDGFVDGATTWGPWAIMGLDCHAKYGVGLGPGVGQKYDAQGKLVEG